MRADNLSGWFVLDLSLFCCETERQYIVKQGLGRQGQGQGLILQGQGQGLGLILPRPRPRPLNLALRPRPRPNITGQFAHVFARSEDPKLINRVINFEHGVTAIWNSLVITGLKMIYTNVCLSPDSISAHVNRHKVVCCLLQKICS